MSGGSYNYLCNADSQELIEKMSDLQDMADRLAGLGYADDAAKETLRLLLTLRQMDILSQTVAERLYYVWRSVEWWDSGDSSEEGLKKALENYRLNHP